MIAHWKITITDKKTKLKIAEVEVVGATLEQMQSDIFYQKRAMIAADLDYNLEKWNIEKFNFTAVLLQEKSEDGKINLNFTNKIN